MSIDPMTAMELVEASLEADYTRVRRAANDLARQLAASGEMEKANRLKGLLRRRAMPLRASGHMEQLPIDQKSRLPLLEEQAPPSSPIFLSDIHGQVVRDFIWDAQHAKQLADKGIAGRINLLLSGAPGTGKTLLASHIAAALDKPLYVVRLDSLVSSLLGDTSKNVRALFDFFNRKGSILFLDEMDAIAKVRDDRHELGELKRVVNTVLQGLDAVDEHSIIIGATNHPQLLDPAIWRRFPYRMDIGLPDKQVRQDMWNHFMFEGADAERSETLAEISEGMSGADIQAIAFAARRHALVAGIADIDMAAVVYALAYSTPGSARLPSRSGVPQDQQRALALRLAERGLNAPKIGSMLGMSRQWALKLLKDADAA